GRITPINVDQSRCSSSIQEGFADFRFSAVIPVEACIHCSKLLSSVALVPPTWNKTHYQGLSNIWRRAAEEFAKAENIFIIGYSMRETDVFFRYLFSLGSQGKTRLRNFWVFNPDPQLETRFRTMVSKNVDFKFHPVRFAMAIGIIGQELGKGFES